MKTERSHLGRIATAIFGTAIIATTGAFAQESEEDVFELSPFEVDASGDVGYLATSTLTGSRLNTRLSDVASSVSVFTEEFLNDTGLTDIQEIVLYSVGSKNGIQDLGASPNINNYLGTANVVRRIEVRGIRATKGLDYFQAWIPDDGYRIGRYDESRGPNGILFGISEAGGIVNSSTLRANTLKDSGRIRYSTGSYSRSRLEARFNKVILPEVLGITVAGVTQDNGGWRDYETDERDRVYGALKWTPTKRLTIQVMGESGNHYNTRIRPFNASDRFLAWWLNREKFGVDAVTFDSPSGNNPSNDQRRLGVDNTVPRNQGSVPRTRYVYVSNDDSFRNSAGLWQSDSFDESRVASLEDTLAASSVQDVIDAGGSGIQADDPARILDWDGYEYDISQYGFEFPTRLNAAGPDMYREDDFEMYTIMADYRITEKLFVNFAHNHQENSAEAQFDSGSRPEVRGDPNNLLYHPYVADAYGIDESTPNPHRGQLYIESEWRFQQHWIDYDETRAAISYDLDFNDFDMNWLGRHRLAAGWAYREREDQILGTRYGMLGNPANRGSFDDSRNRIQIRNYLTEGDFSTYRATPPPKYSEFTTEEGVVQPIGYIHQGGGTANAKSLVETTSYILALQSYFWNDRIIGTFGWREDEAKNTAFGHIVDPLYGDTISTDRDAAGYREDDPIKANTKTAGVVFHLTNNFSLLANYATSIGLPEFRNIVFPNQGIADPVEGEGYDVGIAFNFLDDRISGRLIWFDTEALNRTASGGGTRIISDPMWQSLRAIDDFRNEYPELVRNPDTGAPFTDSDWETATNALNGASGEGVQGTPRGRVNAFNQDELADGYEFSLTANVTDNWRLTMNVSYTDRVFKNYGREFAYSAGFQQDENGRLIQAVTVNESEDEALSYDRTLLREGSIHRGILEIADNVYGTFTLDDGTEVTIEPGEGALWLNDDDNFDAGFEPEDTVAYKLWESQNELQMNKDERERRWGLSPWKFNVFTAYDFEEGMLDGFTLGGGLRWLEGAIIGQDADGNEFQAPDETYVDLMLRYRQRLKNGKGTIDYQINIYNLFDETDPLPLRFSRLDDPTSPLSRYKLIDPLTVRATITYSF